jgi:hypothetical protein
MTAVASQNDNNISCYFLLLSKFQNLLDVAKLSKNSRFEFVMPKGYQPPRWLKGIAGIEARPVLALAFHRHGFNAGRCTISSLNVLEVCDVQIAERNDESGISRQHL